MKAKLLAILFCLLFAVSCVPVGNAQSPFIRGFSPVYVLSKVGTKTGISYSKESASESSSLREIRKDWTFYFEGSHDQLTSQLNALRTEMEQQLSLANATISGKENWSGDFSGFCFDYASGNKKGFVRVTGVSFESGKQGIEIFVYED